MRPLAFMYFICPYFIVFRVELPPSSFLSYSWFVIDNCDHCSSVENQPSSAFFGDSTAMCPELASVKRAAPKGEGWDMECSTQCTGEPRAAVSGATQDWDGSTRSLHSRNGTGSFPV